MAYTQPSTNSRHRWKGVARVQAPFGVGHAIRTVMSEPKTLLAGQHTHTLFASIHEATGQIYTDQPGRFLVASTAGNSYMLVLYDYDINYIHAEAMQNRTAKSILTAYINTLKLLTTAGLLPQLQHLDNEVNPASRMHVK
jgi:hypothetical protein